MVDKVLLTSFKCFDCNKMYKDKSGLWYHNNKHHCKNNLQSINQE